MISIHIITPKIPIETQLFVKISFLINKYKSLKFQLVKESEQLLDDTEKKILTNYFELVTAKTIKGN